MQPAVQLHKPLVYSLALVKFLIPFLLVAPAFELQRDEFLYYEQGLHPALGFLENPPLLSYLAGISAWLGGTEWSVKIWPALIGALTVMMACKITTRLGGRGFAQFLTGFGMITGAFLRIHILFQPNILDIFFWTCSLYFLVCFIQTKSYKYILWLSVCIALGWWSKYSIVFLAVSILIGLLLSQYRSVLLNKKTYLAILVSVILILPNLCWQYFHNWPLIHHMKELRETQLIFINPMDFIKDQFLLLFPVMIVWIAGLVWLFRNKNYRIFGWIYLSVIVLLILGSGKNYYSLGVYSVLLAAGGVAWENMSESKKWIRYVIGILVIGITIPFLPIGLPMMNPEKLAAFYKQYGVDKSGLLKWEDQRDHDLPQDFADMLGWKEAALKTEKFYNQLPDSVKNNVVIFGRHYGHAGGIKFYSSNKTFTDKVFTDNGSFLLWIPENFSFKHLILVSRRMPGPDDEVFQYFEKVSVVDSVTNHYSRQFGDKIFFFENINATGLQLAQDGLKEMKSVFKR
ncbi:MAG TPA: glycosyltransferase family 39 protein [Chitinophagaceae bacterium]|nr:glycosyltransferase family 39 protein [Chitinophagaceae bacterium]